MDRKKVVTGEKKVVRGSKKVVTGRKKVVTGRKKVVMIPLGHRTHLLYVVYIIARQKIGFNMKIYLSP